MPFKLIVSKEDEPESRQEHVYNKENIVIGRDLSCDLQLEGIKSVVSRRHAEIKHSDTGFEIEDQKSRNFTFLNEKKLKAGTLYDLHSGDIIQICDFNIEFIIESHETRYLEKTILDYPNPFLQHAVQLMALLSQISQDYDEDTSDRKEEAFKEAFYDLLKDLSKHKAIQIIIQSVMNINTEALPEIQRDSLLAVKVSSSEAESLMNLVLDIFLKLLQARRQFRMEFIGETMIRTAKSFSIYSCTTDEFKEFLFSPEISTADKQKRMQLLKSLGDELMLHQVSLLEGYKRSVNEGTRQLLERLDPDSIQSRMQKKKKDMGPSKLALSKLPVLESLGFKKLYSEVYQDLAKEDRSIIEKKYFRPSYVKRYNKCMDSAVRDQSHSGTKKTSKKGETNKQQ
jgi:predicted component of type VI protein secretion system